MNMKVAFFEEAKIVPLSIGKVGTDNFGRFLINNNL